LHALARRAEEHGYDSLWTSDHFVVPKVVKTCYPGSADGEFPPEWRAGYLSCQSILAYLAAATDRVGLGTSALVLPLRNPVQLAKEVATIDVLSGGRVQLGVGVGYSEDEFDALGIPFADRGARMDEALQVLRALWTTDPASFSGRHYGFGEVSALPHPVQRPHPPLLVAGFGRAAYRRAARLGDGWHAAGVAPEILAPMVADLRVELDRLGRQPADVPVSVKMSMRFTDGPAEVVDAELRGDADGMVRTIERFADLGVELIVLDYGFDSSTLDGALGLLDRFERDVRPRLT
jgi:probable F420-dependent oxidoreductase